MKWTDFLKRDTFIYNYMKECEKLETATDFDFWSAIWILSLLINRNVIIDRPGMPLYPNFFITFIANSGMARKSSSISLAKRLLTSIINKNNIENIDIVSTFSTPAKLLYSFNNQSLLYNSCIVGVNCSEFITFFKNKNVIETFTDFYDCPDERKGYGTVSHGNFNIRNVFISTLSGSTPNYYLKAVSEEEIEGGFTSRNIIVYAEKGKKRIAWNTSSTSFTECIKYANDINKIFAGKRTKLQLTDKAIYRYSKWYNRRRLNAKDLYTQSFEAREQDFILKLAGILAVNDRKTRIFDYHIDYAIKAIKYMKNIGQKFMKNEIYSDQTDSMSKTLNRFKEVLHSYGENGVKHRALYLRFHNSLSKDEFSYIINVLHELGLIEKLMPLSGKAVIYRETDKLMSAPLSTIMKKLT